MRPTKNKGNKYTNDDVYKHPAYGMVSCGRISGDVKLVGSELKHQHYISLKIQTAERHRSLGRNWFFGRRVVTEILLSEHQWATFVASMNMGEGVPCTFRLRPEESYKLIDVPTLQEDSNHDVMNRELEEAGAEIIQNLKGLTRELQDMGENTGAIKKTKFKEIVRKMGHAVDKVCSTLPFYVSQHKEAMEKNVEAAKSDVEGYVTDMVTKLGIEQLSDIAPKLEYKEEE